jgi:hypothetical protein
MSAQVEEGGGGGGGSGGSSGGGGTGKVGSVTLGMLMGTPTLNMWFLAQVGLW